MQDRIVAHENPFHQWRRSDSGTESDARLLTELERLEYGAWSERCDAGTPDPQPIHLIQQLILTKPYPDKEIYDVPGYGRVWLCREGNWHHNGPKIDSPQARFLNLPRERFFDAVSDLINAVHEVDNFPF